MFHEKKCVVERAAQHDPTIHNSLDKIKAQKNANLLCFCPETPSTTQPRQHHLIPRQQQITKQSIHENKKQQEERKDHDNNEQQEERKEKTNRARKWVAKAASKENTFGRRRVKTQTVCGHAGPVQDGDSAVQKKNQEEQQAGGAEADEPD